MHAVAHFGDEDTYRKPCKTLLFFRIFEGSRIRLGSLRNAEWTEMAHSSVAAWVLCRASISAALNSS